MEPREHMPHSKLPDMCTFKAWVPSVVEPVVAEVASIELGNRINEKGHPTPDPQIHLPFIMLFGATLLPRNDSLTG